MLFNQMTTKIALGAVMIQLLLGALAVEGQRKIVEGLELEDAPLFGNGGPCILHAPSLAHSPRALHLRRPPASSLIQSPYD